METLNEMIMRYKPQLIELQRQREIYNRIYEYKIKQHHKKGLSYNHNKLVSSASLYASR